MAKAQVILYSAPVNMRLGAEKLAVLASGESGKELTSGDIFVFFNGHRDRCKIIWYDGDDYYTVEKVLDQGTFAPNDKIKISDTAIENFLYDGVVGQTQLLHALRGNVAYIDDARKRQRQ
jgi:hypothetical protein